MLAEALMLVRTAVLIEVLMSVQKGLADELASVLPHVLT